MPDAPLRWYRSLYWRVAVGLIAFLALMLAAEAALFLWSSERIAGTMPAQSPRRLAVLVASDVGTALAANPALVPVKARWNAPGVVGKSGDCVVPTT